MKSLIATARNHILLNADFERESSLVPVVEVVLTIVEPRYEFAEDGTKTRRPVGETVRFYATPRGLRLLAQEVFAWAAESEAAWAGMAELDPDHVDCHEDEIGEDEGEAGGESE